MSIPSRGRPGLAVSTIQLCLGIGHNLLTQPLKVIGSPIANCQRQWEKYHFTLTLILDGDLASSFKWISSYFQEDTEPIMLKNSKNTKQTVYYFESIC